MEKGNFMETNLVMEGVKFMFLGMGTVFAFLIIMIMCMNAMSYIIHRFFPEPQSNATAQTTTGGAQQQDNKKIVAAITAAIAHHRQG
jgi:oxaloacetate decarboxylase gamma subunit